MLFQKPTGRSKSINSFEAYRDSFPNARLTRSKTGVLEVAIHTDGSRLVFNGHTHEQFVKLFHAIGSDPGNRVVILTGSGNASMESINPDGFDFFSPQGYDKILPPLTTRYTRIALTQKLRRIVDEGVGYGLALEGISAADVARAGSK
jgi:hypothetical protein